MNNYGAQKASPYVGYNTTVPGIGPGHWNAHRLAEQQDARADSRRSMRDIVAIAIERSRLRSARRAYLTDGGL